MVEQSDNTVMSYAILLITIGISSRNFMFIVAQIVEDLLFISERNETAVIVEVRKEHDATVLNS
jgi:hypothetical protein